MDTDIFSLLFGEETDSNVRAAAEATHEAIIHKQSIIFFIFSIIYPLFGLQGRPERPPLLFFPLRVNTQPSIFYP